jgi:hypothetical protein
MNRYLRWGVVLLVIVLLVLSAGCQAGNNEPLPEPEPEPEPVPEPPPIGDVNIYVAGYFGNPYRIGDVHYPCYWENGKRIDLVPVGAADNVSPLEWPRGVSGYANSVFVDSGDVYVAGGVNFENSAVNILPCYWKNAIRSDLDIGTANAGHACSIFISKGNVYVCGYTTIWGRFYTFIPCYWMNGRRIDLPVNGTYGVTTAIIISREEVYVSGSLWNSERAAYIFGYWKNGIWTELFTARNSGLGGLYSLAVVGNDVFAAGWTDSAAGKNVPSYWKNGIRTNLSVLDTARSGRANAVFSVGDELYLAGWSKSNQGASIPCYWRDGARTDLSVQFPIEPNEDRSAANSIQVLGGNVCVVGEIHYATAGRNDTIYLPHPCYWLNGVRTDLSAPVKHMHGYGRSIFLTGK